MNTDGEGGVLSLDAYSREREFQSPAGEMAQSPTGSFHTAASLDSFQDDLSTEVEEEEIDASVRRACM